MIHPITIIGTGLAGYTVAREFRKLDKNISLRLITADDGSFYSKPMLSSAFTEKKTPENLIISEVTTLAPQLNAEILTHSEVTHLDLSQNTLHLKEKSLYYSQLILAWGAEPLRLSLAGNASHQVISVNNLTDYRQLRIILQKAKRVVILGAGLIGCEFANDLQWAGFHVTVIDPGQYPLKRFLPEIAGVTLQQILANLGVVWHFEQTAIRMDSLDSGYQLTLSNQSTITADVVLSAVGLRPRTTLATMAGLTVERGIVVNRFLQTQIKNVYALGDCAQVAGFLLPFVMPIMWAARALVKTLSGQLTAVTYPAMPITVKTSAYPIVVSPSPDTTQGYWDIKTQQHNIRAIFYTTQGKISGFALTGSATAEKTALTKKLPPLL